MTATRFQLHSETAWINYVHDDIGWTFSDEDAAILGVSYEIQPHDVVFNLKVRGENVGYLVITPYSVMQRFGIARAVVFPIGIISFILTLFLVIVSTLLIRRFVNPLADVIYAARVVEQDWGLRFQSGLSKPREGQSKPAICQGVACK